MRGAHALQEALCHHLGVAPNEMTSDGEYTIEPMRCLGLCDHAPAALVNETRHFEISPDNLEVLLNNKPSNEQVAYQVCRIVDAQVCGEGQLGADGYD